MIVMYILFRNAAYDLHVCELCIYIITKYVGLTITIIIATNITTFTKSANNFLQLYVSVFMI